ncbi:hypothetical protein A33K_18857 [Burkholderia humptydooensis MSMB43]|uniref:Uncharacterized protein n=1 Tax=Burkholderia humptydooensis MSMB43 TaxID=441157 RepID=A0ABN0FX39_9BURK|nr:hypothetical protein A33K_18857 [Burkholderia humptydooensis MSMB43]
MKTIRRIRRPGDANRRMAARFRRIFRSRLRNSCPMEPITQAFAQQFSRELNAECVGSRPDE